MATFDGDSAQELRAQSTTKASNKDRGRVIFTAFGGYTGGVF
jgi:hypothetical protein